MAIPSTDLQLWSILNNGTLNARLASNALNNVFPSISGAQNRDRAVSLAYVVWLNNNASQALTACRIYFRVVTAGGATLEIALDPRGPQPRTGQFIDTSNPPTAYSTPTSIGAGLSVATLNPGNGIGVWIRRTATASAQMRPERNTLTLAGTSPP